MATSSSTQITSQKSTTALLSKNRSSAEKTDLSTKFSNAGFSSNRGTFNLTQVPVRPRLISSPQIQCCAKDGGNCSCPKCAAERQQHAAEQEQSSDASTEETSEPSTSDVENSSTQQTPAASDSPEASPTTSETAATEGPTPGFIVDDSTAELSGGQLKKTEFLQRLREQICTAVGPVLATAGQTTEGCPYLNYWLDLYQTKDATEVERTVRRYAPDSVNATSASDYISIVTQRALRAAEVWARTGKITGVPEGVSTNVPAGAAGPAPQPASVQAKAKSGGVKNSKDPYAIKEELGDGQPLASGVRSKMESAFGMSFSDVRTHTDSNAASISNQVNARAFTVGNHVAFGTGEYQPGTLVGDALIAHELAHTIQQQNAGEPVQKMEAGDHSYNALENDADQTAISVMSSLWGEKKSSKGISALRSGLRLQRCDGCGSGGCNTRSGPGSGSAAAVPVVKKRTVAPAATGNCGQYSWGIQWYLDNATSSTQGWIVQNIRSTHNVKGCDNVTKTDAEMRTLTGGWDPSWYPFWEGWQVRNGVIYVGSTTQVHSADTFGWSGPGDDTKGTRQVSGTANFYPNATLPSTMVPRNGPPAHALPYTQTDPGLTGGTGALQHDIGSSWDCCPKADGTKDRTTTVNPV
jgi:hypothetical protein